MEVAKVARVLAGRRLVHELQKIGRDARTGGHQKAPEHRHERPGSFIWLSPLCRLGNDDRPFEGNPNVVRHELHRLLEKPFTSLEGHEGTDLEREAIATLLQLLHQLAHADVSANRFPSVRLRRPHAYPMVE